MSQEAHQRRWKSWLESQRDRLNNRKLRLEEEEEIKRKSNQPNKSAETLELQENIDDLKRHLRDQMKSISKVVNKSPKILPIIDTNTAQATENDSDEDELAPKDLHALAQNVTITPAQFVPPTSLYGEKLNSTTSAVFSSNYYEVPNITSQGKVLMSFHLPKGSKSSQTLTNSHSTQNPTTQFSKPLIESGLAFHLHPSSDIVETIAQEMMETPMVGEGIIHTNCAHRYIVTRGEKIVQAAKKARDHQIHVLPNKLLGNTTQNKNKSTQKSSQSPVEDISSSSSSSSKSSRALTSKRLANKVGATLSSSVQPVEILSRLEELGNGKMLRLIDLSPSTWNRKLVRPRPLSKIPLSHLSFYDSLVSSDLVISIEYYFDNCEEYEMNANKILRFICREIYHRYVNVRLGVICIKTRDSSMFGCFEVQIAYRTPSGDLLKDLLHSKLHFGNWPSEEEILENLNVFFSTYAPIPKKKTNPSSSSSSSGPPPPMGRYSDTEVFVAMDPLHPEYRFTSEFHHQYLELTSSSSFFGSNNKQRTQLLSSILQTINTASSSFSSPSSSSSFSSSDHRFSAVCSSQFPGAYPVGALPYRLTRTHKAHWRFGEWTSPSLPTPPPPPVSTSLPLSTKVGFGNHSESNRMKSSTTNLTNTDSNHTTPTNSTTGTPLTAPLRSSFSSSFKKEQQHLSLIEEIDSMIEMKQSTTTTTSSSSSSSSGSIPLNSQSDNNQKKKISFSHTDSGTSSSSSSSSSKPPNQNSSLNKTAPTSLSGATPISSSTTTTTPSTSGGSSSKFSPLDGPFSSSPSPSPSSPSPSSRPRSAPSIRSSRVMTSTCNSHSQFPSTHSSSSSSSSETIHQNQNQHQQNQPQTQQHHQQQQETQKGNTNKSITTTTQPLLLINPNRIGDSYQCIEWIYDFFLNPPSLYSSLYPSWPEFKEQDDEINQKMIQKDQEMKIFSEKNSNKNNNNNNQTNNNNNKSKDNSIKLTAVERMQEENDIKEELETQRRLIEKKQLEKKKLFKENEKFGRGEKRNRELEEVIAMGIAEDESLDPPLLSLFLSNSDPSSLSTSSSSHFETKKSKNERGGPFLTTIEPTTTTTFSSTLINHQNNNHNNNSIKSNQQQQQQQQQQQSEKETKREEFWDRLEKKLTRDLTGCLRIFPSSPFIYVDLELELPTPPVKRNGLSNGLGEDGGEEGEGDEDIGDDLDDDDDDLDDDEDDMIDSNDDHFFYPFSSSTPQHHRSSIDSTLKNNNHNNNHHHHSLSHSSSSSPSIIDSSSQTIRISLGTHRCDKPISLIHLMTHGGTKRLPELESFLKIQEEKQQQQPQQQTSTTPSHSHRSHHDSNPFRLKVV